MLLKPDHPPTVRIMAGPSSSRRRSELSTSTSCGAMPTGPAAALLPSPLDMDLRSDCHDQRRVGERAGRPPVLLHTLSHEGQPAQPS